jgi:hypothetical protein
MKSHFTIFFNVKLFQLILKKQYKKQRKQKSTPMVVLFRDTYYETGDPARLPAQLAGRWGQIN